MGILVDKVRKAFKHLRKGNLLAYTLAIADVSDVKYQFHFDIVISEIRKEMKLYKIWLRGKK